MALLCDLHGERSFAAAGMAGGGSECFGYDDAVSRDHDFEAGFTLWLNDEAEAEHGFKLMRAYGRLPREFMGVRRQAESVYFSSRWGVQTIGGFFERTIGLREAPQNWRQWFYTPEHSLACATNGSVFTDEPGEFTSVREQLLHGMPQDVRLKKLAGNLASAAQSGQYNYWRCILHGETGAAQVTIAEFADKISRVILSLGGRYAPYYKWRFRALREVPMGESAAQTLSYLLETGNGEKQAKEKRDMIERLCAEVIGELKSRGLSESGSDYLEQHAFAVNEKITLREIRSLHIMENGEG